MEGLVFCLFVWRVHFECQAGAAVSVPEPDAGGMSAVLRARDDSTDAEGGTGGRCAFSRLGTPPILRVNRGGFHPEKPRVSLPSHQVPVTAAPRPRVFAFGSEGPASCAQQPCAAPARPVFALQGVHSESCISGRGAVSSRPGPGLQVDATLNGRQGYARGRGGPSFLGTGQRGCSLFLTYCHYPDTPAPGFCVSSSRPVPSPISSMSRT